MRCAESFVGLDILNPPIFNEDALIKVHYINICVIGMSSACTPIYPMYFLFFHVVSQADGDGMSDGFWVGPLHVNREEVTW